MTTIVGLRVVGTANELDEHGSTTTFYRIRSWTEAGAISTSLKTYRDFEMLHGVEHGVHRRAGASSHAPGPLPPCAQPLQTLEALDEYVRTLALDSPAVLAFLQPSSDDTPVCNPTAQPRSARSSNSQCTTAAIAAALTAPLLRPPRPLPLLPLLPLLPGRLASEPDGVLLCMFTAQVAAAAGRRRSCRGWVSQPLDASVPCSHVAM